MKENKGRLALGDYRRHASSSLFLFEMTWLGEVLKSPGKGEAEMQS